jgi:DNA-binding IclR family transcriptional regulator
MSPAGSHRRKALAAGLIRKRRSSRRSIEDAGSSKSLQKAIRILLHLGQDGPEMSITQIAAGLALNKSTVFRLLNAMEKFELIEKNRENERYRLGLKLHELGQRAVQSRTLRSEAHRFLMELSRRSNESVSLAVPGAGGVICLDRVDCSNSIITVRTPVGARFPAHCTAAGKAVLSQLTDAEAYAILARNGMKMYTSGTLIRWAAVLENLEFTRRQGFATDHEELERGLSGVAVPLIFRESQLVAAVGMAGPTARFLGEDLAKKIALLKDFAARISKAVGKGATEFTAH